MNLSLSEITGDTVSEIKLAISLIPVVQALMFKVPLFLFITKLYAWNDIFKYTKKKHGKDVITVIRSLEKVQTKYGNVVADKKYIKICKKEHLIPTFFFSTF